MRVCSCFLIAQAQESITSSSLRKGILSHQCCWSGRYACLRLGLVARRVIPPFPSSPVLLRDLVHNTISEEFQGTGHFHMTYCMHIAESAYEHLASLHV